MARTLIGGDLYALPVLVRTPGAVELTAGAGRGREQDLLRRRRRGEHWQDRCPQLVADPARFVDDQYRRDDAPSVRGRSPDRAATSSPRRRRARSGLPRETGAMMITTEYGMLCLKSVVSLTACGPGQGCASFRMPALMRSSHRRHDRGRCEKLSECFSRLGKGFSRLRCRISLSNRSHSSSGQSDH